jgi:hypothetical protein
LILEISHHRIWTHAHPAAVYDRLLYLPVSYVLTKS